MSRGRTPPAPTREHHDDFCVTEEWTLARVASGQPVRHQRTYELPLWDGRTLRTRISRPVDSTTYRSSMWSHILREQLEVSSDEFWRCALDGVTPDRGGPATRDVSKALPLYLVRELTARGVTRTELKAMDAAAAASRLAELIAGENH
ncbi:hypothetical protein [Demequina sp. NBRC 110054]|uniref:hypothetical protein n=1 Tax=Demequina sp. NBRC 110054 TaxID=1570343 RepID=UPI0009FFA0FD|nr:hypothetical protein [Demequina sp. NBRC 110054]